MSERVYLASPHMGEQEIENVQEAFRTNWIAPVGPFVNQFEKSVSKYVGAADAAALSSGTSAIHLALKAVGIKEGDRVCCSALTFAASCNPIIYEKAQPIFIDSEPNSWNMSSQALEKAFNTYKGQIKAVIVVNLYGQSADMDAIIEICSRYNVPIIEDSAESLGATYKGKKSGTLGLVGIYSFNGNKIITTSGGGMLVSCDQSIVDRVRFWATQAKEPARYYQHNEIGYNYRMSNVCAAIGCGQMTVLEDRIKAKKAIYEQYKKGFSEIEDIEMMPICDYGESNYWLSCITLKATSKVKPLHIIKALEKENIESRLIWKPMQCQPVFKQYPFFKHHETGISVAEDIFNRGLCLPSDTKMNQETIDKIIGIVKGLWEQGYE